MKLAWVIQLCKNVFDINNCITVLTFHEQDLTKRVARDLHGPEPDARPVPGPGRDFSNRPVRAGKKEMSSIRAWKIGPCRPLFHPDKLLLFFFFILFYSILLNRGHCCSFCLTNFKEGKVIQLDNNNSLISICFF